MAKINDENAAALPFHAAHVMSAAARRAAMKTPNTIRKQAFGELNNLMKASTPVEKYTSAFRPSITICNDVFRKHQQRQVDAANKRIKYTSASTLTKEENDEEDEEENLFDYFDYGSCTKTCRKTDQEIWSKENLLSEDLLNKLLAGCKNDRERDLQNDFEENRPFERSDDVEITDVLNFPDNDDIIAPEFPPDFDIHSTFDPFII